MIAYFVGQASGPYLKLANYFTVLAARSRCLVASGASLDD